MKLTMLAGTKSNVTRMNEFLILQKIGFQHVSMS